jgi:hypothetical protein
MRVTNVWKQATIEKDGIEVLASGTLKIQIKGTAKILYMLAPVKPLESDSDVVDCLSINSYSANEKDVIEPRGADLLWLRTADLGKEIDVAIEEIANASSGGIGGEVTVTGGTITVDNLPLIQAISGNVGITGTVVTDNYLSILNKQKKVFDCGDNVTVSSGGSTYIRFVTGAKTLKLIATRNSSNKEKVSLTFFKGGTFGAPVSNMLLYKMNDTSSETPLSIIARMNAPTVVGTQISATRTDFNTTGADTDTAGAFVNGLERIFSANSTYYIKIDNPAAQNAEINTYIVFSEE